MRGSFDMRAWRHRDLVAPRPHALRGVSQYNGKTPLRLYHHGDISLGLMPQRLRNVSEKWLGLA